MISPDGAVRLRFVARVNPSKNEIRALPGDTQVTFLPMDAVGNDKALDLGRKRLLSEVVDGYTYFRDGDVAIAKITPCFENGKGIFAQDLLNGIGFGTTELTVVRPLKVHGRFLFWSLSSDEFRKAGESSMYGAGGQKRVPDDFVRDFPLHVTSNSRQSALSSFLDRETAKIDTLVGRQRRLIELLEEKRQALISHAVTKGLNPDAPMKDSGVEWPGRIPAHWKLVSNGSLFRERIECGLEGLPVLSVSLHTGVSEEEEETGQDGRLRRKIEDRASYKRVRKGDLAYNMMRAWRGAMGVVPTDGLVSPAYVVAAPKVQLATAYFAYLYRTRGYMTDIERYSKGITSFRWRLYWEEFKAMRAILPPFNEQAAIVSHIGEESRKIDTLMSKARKAIDLLRERRAALISAAVTGKIDVRNAV